MNITFMRTCKTKVIYGAVSFVLAFGIVFGLYYIYGFVPFGTWSLAWEDANIQYLSFFAYLKDVWGGNNDIGYSFSKSLGGSNVGVAAYYLMSPFNILLLFFKKAQLNTFFNLITALKIATAGCTFSFFLCTYFQQDACDRLSTGVCNVLLSLSYALSQYCLAQSSNTMWLDGVYMLPLILAGIHRLVYRGTYRMLSVCVGLSILFNWYSGGINGLFSIIWFFFELFSWCSVQQFPGKRGILKTITTVTIRYGLAMVLGVMLSCIVFLPTVIAMGSSSRGDLEFHLLKDLSIQGIRSLISNYTLGAVSRKWSTSLFCGTFALVGCLGSFFVKGIPLKKKLLLLGLGAVGVLLVCWNPLYVAFSLFKSVYSFWCRYSYVVIVIVLFLAAHFYFLGTGNKIQILVPFLGCCCGAALMLFNKLGLTQNVQLTNLTVCFMITISMAVGVAMWVSSAKKYANPIALGLMSVLIVAELACGAKLQMDNYHIPNVQDYEAYTQEAERQIQQLSEYDPGTYRITQTSTRYTDPSGLTAHYNESLAYNYWSITSYTSAADLVSMQFLERLGYRSHGDAATVVNTSVLAADSLLGVKYVLSKTPIAGLVPVSGMEIYNGKMVYENPYALPFALRYTVKEWEPLCYSDPFVFQNQLYSQLLGEEAALYIPMAYEMEITESENQRQTVRYKITLPRGNYAFYGNLPHGPDFNGSLKVNDSYTTGYAKWLSPSVFYIPNEDGAAEAVLSVDSAAPCSIAFGSEQFYALDLDLLAEVSKKLSAKKAESISVEDGEIRLTIEADGEENLYLSVPYDDCWKVVLNGNTIETELFGGCLYAIPLQKGTNEIHMTYHVRGIAGGFALFALALVILLFSGYLEKAAVLHSKHAGEN